MIDNIRRVEGEGAAMEVLDTLRALRQTHPKVRMVYTGSIGLHNVITSLKRAGYANDPINDMDVKDLPPLLPKDAQELVRCLLEGERIQTEDLQATVQAIANLVDNVPYYIHQVVARLAEADYLVNEALIGEIVEDYLTDYQDAWHMIHYRERMNKYYTDEERPFALNLLDILSVADQPLAFNDIFNKLKSHLATEDKEMVREVLVLLQRDHYVVRERDGKYRFNLPLIQRWWQLHRR